MCFIRSSGLREEEKEIPRKSSSSIKSVVLPDIALLDFECREGCSIKSVLPENCTALLRENCNAIL